MANQQQFNQKRSDYFANQARETFERLQQEGELKPAEFFAAATKYLLPLEES